MLERTERIKRAWDRISPMVDFTKSPSWFAPDMTPSFQCRRWEQEPDFEYDPAPKFEFRLHKYTSEDYPGNLILRVECEGVVVEEFIRDPTNDK